LNAEKFTEKGVVKISVDSPSATDEYLSVHIIDNGIGIPKEHLTKIFHRFYQVDGSSTRKYGGTGLGLAIVREIIEAHRCKIHVESEEGIGSRFSFTLPILRQTTDASHLRKVKIRPGKHHASKLVEVVEDDPNVGGIIKSLLEDEGFAVIQAHTGEDAIAIAREHHPDLITLDVYLPDVNGFDLLSQLHSDQTTTDIPIIVLSIVMDKEKGFRLGAADYLEKPIDANKLRESVLRISEAIDGIGGAMKIMIADDDANTVQFLQDLLSSEGYQVCSNLGGKEAVQKARMEKPDLILLDLVMPDLDGLDVLQQLKAEIDTRDIPVIVLTGKARMEDRDRSLLLGAQDFVMKPLELREIVDQVKKYFGALDG
jgi:DNA-binding response OmpR family regulator